jgi:hypothetical protein
MALSAKLNDPVFWKIHFHTIFNNYKEGEKELCLNVYLLYLLP